MEKEKFFYIRKCDWEPSLTRSDYGLVVELNIERGELKNLSGNQEILKTMNLYQNPNGVFCISNDCIIKDIDKPEAEKIVNRQKEEWAQWQNYMSNTNNLFSFQLNGLNLEKL